MRFVDSNVFLYAILKPKRKLTKQEEELKDKAKRIYQRIIDREEVILSVVHLSEIANVLEDVANLASSINFIEEVYKTRNIHVEGVTKEEYLSAVLEAKNGNVSINDMLAYLIMARKGIKEIFSFDKHFDNLNVIRIEE
ncbi:MAG: type II toxin-antitoxin system VapC family toxin [Candidatus Freyarchaeota archaeon]|nr:type II toxin-antitoxin system VapC family toxin [Candidatus Jordarchaeia archaeon]MBS7269744.1 type II toxin-antitoxin system VapC family toxin [Candidatus Jordarchaeia archaeon]MBS7280539.1 type II toxin-antitoxin system VapC family toxin [Candidatus Jordarchaeia archaeon]